MTSEELERLLTPVLALTEEAGIRIMEIYETDFTVEEKSDHTPLTAADLAAHHTLVAGLRNLTPELPILSEEDVAIPYEERRTWRRYWLVDPLDGTREFVRRNDQFCVCVALIEEGVPQLGAIHAPALGVDYYAARGLGAFRRHLGGRAESIHTRALATPVTVTCGRPPYSNAFRSFLNHLDAPRITLMGGAIKSCLVAEGSADVYARFGPTSEWDTAAAQCILEEAGGRLVGLDFNPLRYNAKRSLANPHFLAIGDPRHDWASYLEKEPGT